MTKKDAIKKIELLDVKEGQHIVVFLNDNVDEVEAKAIKEELEKETNREVITFSSSITNVEVFDQQYDDVAKGGE